MPERKKERKKLLRAAVALSLLGAMAIPAEIGALEPRRDKYMTCFYENAFDWTTVSSTPIDVSIGGTWGYGENSIDIRLRSEFCAYNGTVGKKQIAYLFNTKYRRPYLETDWRHDYDGYKNEWNKVSSTSYKRTASDEISQNGAKLRNTQEHWITLEGNYDNYSSGLYYEIKEASDSSLNFEDNGITWKTGDTLITLGRKFDFGKSGLTVNLDSLKVKNPEDIVLSQSMILINDGTYHDYTAFYDAMKPSLSKTTSVAYTDVKPTKSITTSGALNMGLSIGKSDNKNTLNLVAQSNAMKTLDLDLSKVGIGDDKDAWNTKDALYKGTKINTDSLTITVKDTLAGGTTDENFKAGDTMTLLDLSGSKLDRSTWKAGTIITKYGNDTINGSKDMDVKFSDTSTGGMTVTGTHTDTLSIRKSTSGLLGMNYNYKLVYAIGQKNIEDVTASTIDLTKEGFTADSGYTIGKDLALDFSQTTFTNLANAESNKSYTLLNFTDATWESGKKLSFKDSTDSTVTRASNEYVVTEAKNGVTALGTKDLTFTLDQDRKKVDISASDAHVSKIQLGAYDMNQETQTIGNLVSGGTIDASGLSIKGMSLQEAADGNQTLTLAKSEGNTTFTGWSASPATQGYAVYDDGHGTTGTLAGTFDTSDGNIQFKADGLESIAFKEINFINWKGVTLTSGKLRSVDVSNIYNFWGYYFGYGGTNRLLDAKNLSNENIDLVGVSSTWTKRTLTDGNTTLTTYQSPLTRKTESVSAAGMTLSLREAEQYTMTKTQTSEGKYNFSVDFTFWKKIATGFSTEKITWKKDEDGKSYGLKLNEDYDFTALADGAISFDASDPYALIANPDQVGVGETMTFFDAGNHITKAEWDSKVSIKNPTGQSAPTYSAQDHAVTIEGSVNLDITKDDVNHKVIGTISDEYLSKVKIDLSKLGSEETETNNKWENGKILYSASKQDYGNASRKTTIEVSGTTDESVKAGESMTLVHIEGKNAGVSGNITAFNDEKKTVAFKDTTTNGFVAEGTHEDTLKSTVSGEAGQGSYDLTYTVGQKKITGMSATKLDLTKEAFTAGDQYTLESDLTIDVSRLIIGETGSSATPKAIINFSDDSRKLSLSGGTADADGKVKSDISYTETDAEAENGVKATNTQSRTFSVADNVVYVDSVNKETTAVTIGTVDLSKDTRSFHDLADKGTIDAANASYSYSENKKISDVAGQTIQIVGVTDGNKFNNGNWTGLPTTETTIAVNQETGISAKVNATYDTSDGNINLKTNGLTSLTFGKDIAWEKDATAVSLTGQDVGTLDFSQISFADTETKKNETMHLLSAQGMAKQISTVNTPASGWVARTDAKTGTTYYDKEGRNHDDADNLSGNGITLSVDRGDRIAMTTKTEDGKTNTTLDYTRGQGYVTGMTIDEKGITWENGKTAITLSEDYDFSLAALTFSADKLTVSNASTLKSGDSMTLFDANKHMTDTDWSNKIAIGQTSKTVGEYTNQEENGVTITGKIGIDLAKEDSQKVVANVTEQYMTNIKVDLSKITTTDSGSKARNARAALCSNSTSGQDYGEHKVEVSVDNEDEIFGGTTDETVRAGDWVTLLDITGTHAAGEGNITAIDLTSTMAFRDTQANGLTITGTHTDTIKSKVSSIDDTTSNYQLIYTVGTKELNADSVISAAELDMTKEAFTATGLGDDTYTMTGDVTIDLKNITVKNAGDGTKKAFIDFSTGDTGIGKFILKNDDEEGTSSDSNSVTNTISYAEEEEFNGIWAAGTQTRQFSVTNNGKTVWLDSVSQDVNHLTIGMVDVDVSKGLRSFSNLAKEGTISIIESISEDGSVTEGNVILDNLALTKDWGTNFTIAEVEEGNNFSGWTLPTDSKDVYCRQETGVVGIMEGKFNAGETEEEKAKGNLMIKMEGIKSIYFADGVKWENGRTVLDFAGSGVDFTGKSIDASMLAFDQTSVDNLVITDGAYQMILINTDADNHLDKAEITNKTDIKMTVADTLTFTGETKLTADKLQFVADMWKGTGTATDAAHRHVMAQAASSQAIVTGNVDATDSISRALSHYRADDESGNTMTFASIGGSKTRTETGSHISQHLWNVNAGVGTRKDLANGAHTEYGLYYEGGTGSYSTHGVGEGIEHTSGDLTHHGAGFLFRYENKNAVYGEAGIHAGRVKNENKALGLDDSATYYGFHLGVGKIIETSAKDSVDLYTKFYWNHTGGLDYRNSAITEIDTDSVTSKLLRIGGRYSHQLENDYSFYTGAAFSYEFGGRAGGSAGIINGDFSSIRTATTKGGGALLEVGFKKEATSSNPWEFDFSLKGYLGRQKGIGGNIGVNYHF